MTVQVEREAHIDGTPAVAARVAGGRTEASLVRAARRGSREAIEALVRLHWGDAYRAAYLIVQDAGLAEDVAQEAMVAAVGGLGDLSGRPRFRPWLHRIVVNRSIDVVRARRRRAEVVTAPSDWIEQAQEWSFPIDARLPDDLMDALAALSPEDRALIVMRHLLDLRSIDIARSLGIPAATVRTRLRRAMEAVRAHLEANDDGGAR